VTAWLCTSQYMRDCTSMPVHVRQRSLINNDFMNVRRTSTSWSQPQMQMSDMSESHAQQSWQMCAERGGNNLQSRVQELGTSEAVHQLARGLLSDILSISAQLIDSQQETAPQQAEVCHVRLKDLAPRQLQHIKQHQVQAAPTQVATDTLSVSSLLTH
jgi:hypothetical protein